MMGWIRETGALSVESDSINYTLIWSDFEPDHMWLEKKASPISVTDKSSPFKVNVSDVAAFPSPLQRKQAKQ